MADWAEAAILAHLERPAEGQTVAGIGTVSGWAFSDSNGAQIIQVTLLIDGIEATSIPCCSARGDVAREHPAQPNALNSGFGFTINYGHLSAGPHTLGVEIRDSRGARFTRTHTITVVRPGGFEFLDLLDLSSASVEIEEQDLLLSGVRIRDKQSQQAVQIALRLRWFNNLQGLGIVAATTLGPASSHGLAQAAVLGSQASSASLRAALESPGNGGVVAGIGLLRGWVFAMQGRTLRSVQLLVDNVPGPSLPCCSVRGDVANAYPTEPNALHSGFGLTINYGILESGPHNIGVQIEDSDGTVLVLTHAVTVVRPEQFEFLDEFDISNATASIAGQDLVLEGVKLRDKTTLRTASRTLRFRWDITAQAFTLIKESTDEKVLFRDDFADGEAADWTVIGGHWAVVDGEFVETSDQGGTNIAINGPEVTDFQLTAQVRSTDDDDVGVVFRFQDRDNFSLVAFNTQKTRIQLQKRVGGQASTLQTVSLPAITTGIPFEVAVRARQERIQVFVNGRTVIDATDSLVTTGRIGLYSQFNKYAAFDNVQVVTLKAVKNIGGNTIYVDAANEGKTEDGHTEATAWGTIKEALRDPRFQDSAGNTILIKSGVYREQVDIFARMSGIPGAFNTIRAADGAEVIIDGEKGTPRGRVECVLIHTGVSYVRIESLILRNAQHRGLLVFESGPGEIVGNRIHDSGDSGIEFWFGAHNYEVVNNVIYRNEEDGIILSQGSGDDSARFRANRAIMIRNNLIFANGPTGGDGILVRGDRPHSFTIYNNTIVDNFSNGIFIDAGAGNSEVRNNIVAFNGKIGLKNFADSATVRDFNNLFANGTTGDKNYDGRRGPGPNTISADPLFTNPAIGDFRLRAGSPSIDAGDPASRFLDTNGTRNDMGAYGGPTPLVGVPSLH